MINVKLQDVFVVKTDNVEKVKQAIEEYKTNSLRMFADGYGGEDMQLLLLILYLKVLEIMFIL